MSSQTVLITGATSGIGSALFEAYTANGDKVIACGRNKKQLAVLAPKAHLTCQFDTTNKAEVKKSTENVREVDLLILNAGNCRYIEDAQQFDGELFADIVNTNLISLGWILQHLLPKINKGGRIVFISSSATLLPFPRSEAYGASKAGVDYLAKSLKLDLLDHGIDVTLVHPGFIKTPLTDKNNFPMPFILTSEQAAQRIIKGIDNNKDYLHFPKRLTWLLKLFSLLPAPLWQRLILRKNNS